MKTVKKQIEAILNDEFLGHPSREEQADIEKLKQIVLILAQQIDNLINHVV